jgi:glutamate 5-kinase
MKTKIEAAKMATVAGTRMIIASGKVTGPLSVVDAGGTHTLFRAEANPVTARKAWIAGHLEPRGTLVVDDGAVRALGRGKSLLPAGVVRIEGRFGRGDAVVVRDGTGAEVARGLVAYDAEDAERIRGRNSADIEEVLGMPGRAEMIHRDDLVLKGETGS